MKKLIFALLFVVLPASAKSISFKGMNLQLVDKNQAPIKNMKADFQLKYSVKVFDLSCLFTSGAPVGGSFFCSDQRSSEIETFTTDDNGSIDMNKLRYSKLGAGMMYVTVKFDTTSEVKCPGVNYFKSEMTGEMVFDQTIMIHKETVDEFRAEGKKTITCILE